MKSILFHHCAAGVILFAAGMTALGQQDAEKTAASKPAVLVLADAANELTTLARRLTAEGYRIERADQRSVKTPFDRFQTVVVYVHQPLLPPVETGLIGYANRGGRLLVLHHAVASAKMANPKWLAFLGVSIAPRDAAKYPWYVSADITYTMVDLAPGHFITTNGLTYTKKVEYASPDRRELRGTFPAFDLPHTELFHHQRFTDGKDKTILFGYRLDSPYPADAPSGLARMEDTAGWYKRTGKGLTFYLQPGHAEHDFDNANFAQIILNCLAWSGKP